MMNPWATVWANPFQSRTDPFEAWNQRVREFWAAEMQRHQTAMVQEMSRQAWQSWFNAWTVLPFSLMGASRSGRL